VTQTLTITQQLLAGARYLDIRFAGSVKHGLSIWHGFLEGGSLNNILNEIKLFLEQHTKEFVVLEVVPEFGRDISSSQKNDFLECVKRAFGSKIYPGNDGNGLLNGTDLGTIRQKGWQIAVLLHSRFL
jgi:hypothetical protein